MNKYYYIDLALNVAIFMALIVVIVLELTK